MTLISLQQTAIDEILAARTQGKRAASFGFTLLNKNPRVLRGIRNRFTTAALKLGYTTIQAAAQWIDLCDMAKLEAAAQ